MVREVYSPLPLPAELILAEKITALAKGSCFEELPFAGKRRSLRPGDIVTTKTDLQAGFIVGSGVGRGATFYRLYCLDKDSSESVRNLDGYYFDLQKSSQFPLGLTIQDSELGIVVGLGLKGKGGGWSYDFLQKDLSILRPGPESHLRRLSDQYANSAKAAEILDYLAIALLFASASASGAYSVIDSQSAHAVAFGSLAAGFLTFLQSQAIKYEAKEFSWEIGKIYQDTFAKDPAIQKFFEQIFEVSKDISGLQNLLRAPKFRGEMGETLLGNLLEQVLPKDHYKLQHGFKSGETVDAIIRLGSNIVPVDAKFPLENFQAFLASPNEDEKNNFSKKFTADVKNRINEIASKYILPDEGTFDFALMYIPAENIYYETTIKQELLSYALGKRVIPVSPNTFYAYLQVILLGLKGMQVERNAREILANLARMQQDMSRFGEDFRLVGTHIQNALRKYEEADKKLDRFQDKLVASSRNPQASIENLVEK